MSNNPQAYNLRWRPGRDATLEKRLFAPLPRVCIIRLQGFDGAFNHYTVGLRDQHDVIGRVPTSNVTYSGEPICSFCHVRALYKNLARGNEVRRNRDWTEGMLRHTLSAYTSIICFHANNVQQRATRPTTPVVTFLPDSFFESAHERGGNWATEQLNTWFCKGTRPLGEHRQNFWDIRYLFVLAINRGESRGHLGVLIISPVNKTIEYFDSLSYGSVVGRQTLATNQIGWVCEVLVDFLGRDFKHNEWRRKYHQRSKQLETDSDNNCAVFGTTYMLCLAFGYDPFKMESSGMMMRRKRMAMDFVNGGFIATASGNTQRDQSLYPLANYREANSITDRFFPIGDDILNVLAVPVRARTGAYDDYTKSQLISHCRSNPSRYKHFRKWYGAGRNMTHFISMVELVDYQATHRRIFTPRGDALAAQDRENPFSPAYNPTTPLPVPTPQFPIPPSTPPSAHPSTSSPATQTTATPTTPAIPSTPATPVTPATPGTNRSGKKRRRSSDDPVEINPGRAGRRGTDRNNPHPGKRKKKEVHWGATVVASGPAGGTRSQSQAQAGPQAGPSTGTRSGAQAGQST